MSKKRKIKAKKVKTKKIKSKLIGKGSFGCVFRPNIPCKKDVKKNKTIKRDMDRVSKVMLQDSTDEILSFFLVSILIKDFIK